MNSEPNYPELCGRLFGLIEHIKIRSEFRHIDHAADIQRIALEASQMKERMEAQQQANLEALNLNK